MTKLTLEQITKLNAEVESAILKKNSEQLCLELHRKVNSSYDTELIKRSISYSFEKHEGQYRDDKKPYITHPIMVGLTLAHSRMPENVVIAGHLHDVIEHNKEEEVKISQYIIKKIGIEPFSYVKAMTIKDEENINKDEVQSEKIMNYTNTRLTHLPFLKASDSIHNLLTKNGMKPKKGLSYEERIEQYEQSIITNVIPHLERSHLPQSNEHIELIISLINK